MMTIPFQARFFEESNIDNVLEILNKVQDLYNKYSRTDILNDLNDWFTLGEHSGYYPVKILNGKIEFIVIDSVYEKDMTTTMQNISHRIYEMHGNKCLCYEQWSKIYQMIDQIDKVAINNNIKITKKMSRFNFEPCIGCRFRGNLCSYFTYIIDKNSVRKIWTIPMSDYKE